MNEWIIYTVDDVRIISGLALLLCYLYTWCSAKHAYKKTIAYVRMFLYHKPAALLGLVVFNGPLLSDKGTGSRLLLITQNSC